MSNTHEDVAFERAKLDSAIAMTRPQGILEVFGPPAMLQQMQSESAD